MDEIAPRLSLPITMKTNGEANERWEALESQDDVHAASRGAVRPRGLEVVFVDDGGI